AQDADQLIEHVKELRAWEYPAQILSPSQALGLEPSLTLPSDVGEIAYFPEEAYLLTTPAITTLLQYAKSRGATLISNDPVAELLMTSNRLYGVKLVSGIRIEADTVALCTGWRTPTLAAQIDIDVPLTPVDLPGSTAPCLIAYTTPVRDGLTRLICGPGFSARPDENGRVFLEIDDLDEPINLTPDADQLAAYARILFQRARTILPSLAEATIAEHRLCILPLPSDGYPIIGRPPAIEGCYVIVTHSGVTLAAHLATLAATEILTQIDHPTLAPYRLQRF
ncbi:MAG: NAD(P)/FAD-dependent oxidoreductase, partial [Candidatus Dormibacteraceae bacterium]